MYEIYLDTATGYLVIKRHGFILYSLKGSMSFTGFKAPLKISNASNTTPITITTDERNNVSEGDLVTIQGVVGNEAANGNFFANPLDANNFEIYQYQNLSGAIAGSGVFNPNSNATLSLGGTTKGYAEDTIQITVDSLLNPSASLGYVLLPASLISTINGVAPLDTTLNGLINALTALVQTSANSVVNTSLGAVSSFTMTRPANTTAYTVADKVAIGTSLTVTGATNASPIVITATTHGLTDRQPVTISGVTGNTAANGTFYVKVLTANTFALYTDNMLTSAVTGNANYNSGGIIAAAGILKDVVKVAGNMGYIVKLRLLTNSRGWANAIVKMHIFSEPPATIVADSVAYPLMFANASKRVLPVTFDVMVTEGSSSDASGTSFIGAIMFKCAPTSTDLYYVLELSSASGTTLATSSGQQFFVEASTVSI